MAPVLTNLGSLAFDGDEGSSARASKRLTPVEEGSAAVAPAPARKSCVDPPKLSAQEWAGAAESLHPTAGRVSASGGAAPRPSFRHSAVHGAVPTRQSACALAEGLEPGSALTALAAGAYLHDVAPRLIAEFSGTFMLVLTVGVAATGWPGYAAFAISGVLSAQIYTFGSVSGGIFNPAVTLAVLFSGRSKIRPGDAALYVASQILGGFFGGLFAFFITEQTFYFDVTMSPKGTGVACFFLEMFFTAALCLAVLITGTSTDAPNDYFGFAIGGTVLAGALACGGYDQGSFNPAVTVGINMVHYIGGGEGGPSVNSWFLYILGPLCGSIIATASFVTTHFPEVAGHPEQGHSYAEKLLAEGIGTFFLVLTVGVASGDLAPVAIGVMLSVQVYCFGSVSGACLNPAVTLSVVLSRRNKLAVSDALGYVAAQIVGAVVAAVTAWQVVDKSVSLVEKSFGSTLLLELYFTSALCLTVLATGTSKDAPNQYFGFAIGLSVTASAYAVAKHHAGSFNPAVTIGVKLADAMAGGSNPASSWVVFLLGPLLGGLLATGIFIYTRAAEFCGKQGPSDPVKELADALSGLEGQKVVASAKGGTE